MSDTALSSPVLSAGAIHAVTMLFELAIGWYINTQAHHLVDTTLEAATHRSIGVIILTNINQHRRSGQ